MYCPECGNDAGSAKFCPECGANLAGVKDALSGKKAAPAAAGAPAAEAAPGGPGRLSPAIIWGGFGALAVIVIVVVLMMSGGFGGKKADDTGTVTGTAPSAQAVTADTSGSYADLVKRANDLYEQGNTAFQSQQTDQASAYFVAAAKVYEAAWNKKSSDPRVGSDYAFALFSAGDIPAALKQVDTVLKSNADFQLAWFYKGFLISHEGQLAKQKGETKQANEYFAQGRQALAKAVALDPKSDVGKQADSFMSSLPK